MAQMLKNKSLKQVFHLFIFFLKTGSLGSLSVFRGAVPLGKMQGEDDEERHVRAPQP